MTVKLFILCPGTKCSKCRRMVQQVEEAVSESGMDAELKIVDKIEELMQFNTWVLPALVINGKMFARGFVPEKTKIIEEMKKGSGRTSAR
jgi:hypothetical protein